MYFFLLNTDSIFFLFHFALKTAKVIEQETEKKEFEVHVLLKR